MQTVVSGKKTARVQQSSALPECSLWVGEVRTVVVLVWVLYSVRGLVSVVHFPDWKYAFVLNST